MLAGFGKFLLVLALCLQASVLVTGLDAEKNFNDNITSVTTLIPQLSVLNEFSAHFSNIRFAVAGLYGISLLILVTRASIIPFLTILGVAINTFLVTFPTLAKDANNVPAQITVLKNISIIGGLIYLIGSSCPSKCKKQKVE